MSYVEEVYQAAVDKMTPAEKLGRMHAMLAWARGVAERQLRQQLGEMSDERLKLEVALWIYGGDARVRLLIEKKLTDVRS